MIARRAPAVSGFYRQVIPITGRFDSRLPESHDRLSIRPAILVLDQPSRLFVCDSRAT